MPFRPTQFGKYLLLEKIATGGMAELYLAQTTGAGGFVKILAIKKILPHYSAHPEFVSMFIEEAKLTVQLNHANIVQVYDFGETEDAYFLAMEYVEGKNLREISAQAKNTHQELRISHAAYIASEITRGLDFAHRKVDKSTHQPLGIIHRDISPQNIIVSFEGEIKIIDFGIAKAKSIIEETQAGVLKGKFGYMSPEQAEGKEVDHRADIFSTGIILYELLTGVRLFKRESDAETVELIKKANVLPPSHYRPDIPDILDRIVLKSLARNSDNRYQTAMEFHNEITRFLYLYDPDFTTASLAEFVRELFSQEILSSRKRLQQLYQLVKETKREPFGAPREEKRDFLKKGGWETEATLPGGMKREPTLPGTPPPPPPGHEVEGEDKERTEPGSQKSRLFGVKEPGLLLPKRIPWKIKWGKKSLYAVLGLAAALFFLILLLK